MERTRQFLANWREANRRASEAEHALFQAVIAYGKGEGPMPTEEHWQEAQMLRRSAKRLFEEAMASLNAVPPVRYPPASPELDQGV